VNARADFWKSMGPGSEHQRPAALRLREKAIESGLVGRSKRETR
jgi:hypothetical protein